MHLRSRGSVLTLVIAAVAVTLGFGGARTSASIAWGPAGTIATLAGTGSATGPLGDGGWPEQASIAMPFLAAVNAQGTVIFIDAGHKRIRQIQHGIISTIVGCATCNGSAAGTETQLLDPIGVAFAPNGDVLISDDARCQILRYSNGLVAAVAGVPGHCGGGADGPATSTVIAPAGLAVSATGDIYFANVIDSAVPPSIGACSIRRLHAGAIETLAGTGTCGVSADGGAALSSMIGAIDVAYDDATGVVYFSDLVNNRIRAIVAGVVTGVAGNGIDGLYGDGGSSARVQAFRSAWDIPWTRRQPLHRGHGKRARPSRQQRHHPNDRRHRCLWFRRRPWASHSRAAYAAGRRSGRC